MKLRYNSAENRSRFASWRQDRANLWRVRAGGQLSLAQWYAHQGLHNLRYRVKVTGRDLDHKQQFLDRPNSLVWLGQSLVVGSTMHSHELI